MEGAFLNLYVLDGQDAHPTRVVFFVAQIYYLCFPTPNITENSSEHYATSSEHCEK